MSEPISILVRRYQCAHCGRSRSKRTATAEHIGRCWLNPDNRTCKTCENFEPWTDACGCEPGCNWGARGPNPPYCHAGVDLTGDDALPVTNCPLWTAVTES